MRHRQAGKWRALEARCKASPTTNAAGRGSGPHCPQVRRGHGPAVAVSGASVCAHGRRADADRRRPGALRLARHAAPLGRGRDRAAARRRLDAGRAGPGADRRAAAQRAATASLNCGRRRAAAGSRTATSRTSSRHPDDAGVRRSATRRAETGLEPALIARIWIGRRVLRRPRSTTSRATTSRCCGGSARCSTAGLPLVAFLQLARVYGQALAQIADAEVKLLHLYVHEPMIRDGVPVLDIAEQLADARRRSCCRCRAPIMDYVAPAAAAALPRAGRRRPPGARERGDGAARPRARGDRVRRSRRLHAADRGGGRGGGARGRRALRRPSSSETLPGRRARDQDDRRRGDGRRQRRGGARRLGGRVSRSWPPSARCRASASTSAARCTATATTTAAPSTSRRAWAPAATGGEVLVTREVEEAAGRHLAFQPIGEVKLKGFDDATELFLARLADAVSAAGDAARSGGDGPGAAALEARVAAGGLLAGPVVVLLSGGRDSTCLLDLARAARRAGRPRCTSTTACATRRATTRRTARRCARGSAWPLEVAPAARPGGRQRAGVGARPALRGRRTAGARARRARRVRPHRDRPGRDGALPARRLAGPPRAARHAGALGPARAPAARSLTRDDTAAYCAERGLPWREDATNAASNARARSAQTLLPGAARAAPGGRREHPRARSRAARRGRRADAAGRRAQLGAGADAGADGRPRASICSGDVPAAGAWRAGVVARAERLAGPRRAAAAGAGCAGGTRRARAAVGDHPRRVRAHIARARRRATSPAACAPSPTYGRLRIERARRRRRPRRRAARRSPAASTTEAASSPPASSGAASRSPRGRSPPPRSPSSSRCGRGGPGTACARSASGGSRSLQDLFTDRKVPRERRARAARRRSPTARSRGCRASRPASASASPTPRRGERARLAWRERPWAGLDSAAP